MCTLIYSRKQKQNSPKIKQASFCECQKIPFWFIADVINQVYRFQSFISGYTQFLSADHNDVLQYCLFTS